MALQTLHLSTLLLVLLPDVRGSRGHQFVYNGFKGANLTLDGGAAVTPSPLNAVLAALPLNALARYLKPWVTPGGLLMLTNGSIQTKGHDERPRRRSPSPWAPLGLPRPKRPLLQAVAVDLSDVLRGAAEAYVGFFVVGWSFALDGPAPALDISELPALPPTGPKPRSKAVDPKYAELREDWEMPFGPHRFSYKDLFHATRGFGDEQLLGAGGFGSVYRGLLRKTGMEVAVKKVSSNESKQGTRAFVAEVASLGRLRHRNLVQLLGYCCLDKYLYDPSKGALDWPRRLHIIRGVASGLLYLHEDWEQVVVHRDVKASNVLILDSDMNGRLGDFGLARLYDHGADVHTTHVVGTIGYLAPELGHTGKPTPAADVFAFGAFLLEITCGRRPVQQDRDNNRAMLVDRVIEHWRKGLIIDVVDARIPDGYEVSLVLKLGLLCSHPLPSGRPTMRQVMQYLDGNMVLPDLSPAYLGFNEMEERMCHMELSNSMCMSSTSIGTISGLSGGR
ncbi:unnamed protein product [Urochloa decumbens]|uniref:Protein kinase domain-containing protein n=1 Tax=Urochloa decumbens TaxID=240449 RepID=A0ABC9ETH8_9POAL